jgi:hypothetical protein
VVAVSKKRVLDRFEFDENELGVRRKTFFPKYVDEANLGWYGAGANKGTRRAVQWLCPLISAVRARGVERFPNSQTLI